MYLMYGGSAQACPCPGALTRSSADLLSCNLQQAYVYVYGNPPEGQPASNFEGVEHTVPVTDLHSVPQDFTLERNGFQLHRLQVPVGINWENEQEVLPCLTSALSPDATARACCQKVSVCTERDLTSNQP